MENLSRFLEQRLLASFNPKTPRGLILAGVVGCGKTTLIQKCLKQLKKKYQIFSFTSDDLQFRNSINQDTTYLHKLIRSQTQKPALVFIDEIQKSELIFDAIKYAFDQSKISFIISGSNPDFLNTQAKKRLQRRADFLTLKPFSLPEILAHQIKGSLNHQNVFREILLLEDSSKIKNKIKLDLNLSPKILKIIDDYLIYGGLPLAFLAKKHNDKFKEIQMIVERGFEAISVDNNTTADSIRIELAQLHSQEFAYQGIFQKTGLRKRNTINKSIDELINYGYLIKKQPLLEKNRRSYLSIFSYIDPGMVTYLSSETDLNKVAGQRVEGLVHSQLNSLIQNHIPLKASLHYFKPHSIDRNDKTKFKPGEIDFIFKLGSKIVPIEVKSALEVVPNRLKILTEFIQEKKLPFGIVLYRGVPRWDSQNKLLYWPFWMV